MTETLPNGFIPAPPPGSVSPAAVQRPPRKNAAKLKAPKQPKVPKNLHLVTDAEIAAGARKKRAKKAKPEKAVPETVKVSLKEYAAMRTGNGAKLFLKAHKLLGGSDVTLAVRRTVLAELAKMFG